MIPIREVALVLWIFKSGNFFLAHPVDSKSNWKVIIRAEDNIKHDSFEEQLLLRRLQYTI